jgi:hypothetical protein
MSWIAEYDTQGREFPTCVHVTKTTGTMTHGVTYVPIEDGKAVRAENAKLRELVADLWEFGFSKNAGANSVKEWVRKSDELRERVYEALEVDA